MRQISKWYLALFLFMIMFFYSACLNITYVSIGTGSLTGVYYPAGGAVALFTNRKKKHYQIRASVEVTPGSAHNINAVISGELDLAFAQSDSQYHAIKGLGDWKDKGPQTQLRSVCSFYTEVVTLVATDKSKINSLTKLKAKRVNIGEKGSGEIQNALDVLKTVGIDIDKDLTILNLDASDAPKLMQENRLDAFFFTVGHPSGIITEATSRYTRVHFVPITGMEPLLRKSPFYSAAVIPTELYPMANNKGDTPSIGVKATLITSDRIAENVIYAITKEIFDNLHEFKTLHPAFSRLNAPEMLEGLTAPLHAGARKYYRETGLISEKK